MKTQTEQHECAKGNCPINTQQNVVTVKDYKLKCSECGYVAQQYTNVVLCPKCKHGMLYWSYEPQDRLTDYHKRMINRFYGNLTDTKLVTQI